MPVWKHDDLALNYEVIGEGTPLLFLHGWGHSLNTFKLVADNMKKRFRCYLVDLPGFGGSSIPPLSWDSRNYADFMRDFIEDLNLNELSIVGHSFGGKVAVLVSSLLGDRVRKLVLINSAGIKPPVRISKLFKIYLFKFARTIKNSRILLKIGDIIYERVERYSGSADYLSAGQMREILKRVVREDISPELSELRCPVLLLWGEKDDSTPMRDAYRMRELILDSKLIVYPDMGHYLPHESPHQIAHHIKSFIS